MSTSPPPSVRVFGAVEAETSAKLRLPDRSEKAWRVACCLLRTGETSCTLIILRNANSVVERRGKGLRMRPPRGVKWEDPGETQAQD